MRNKTWVVRQKRFKQQTFFFTCKYAPWYVSRYRKDSLREVPQYKQLNRAWPHNDLPDGHDLCEKRANRCGPFQDVCASS